ncbi:hypothetical protein GIY23_09610 [Allosaccharopolyspora coralli]|uniref:SalK n=1 Tax=Allosaccharopolyspora coralli TaxID=2665642 RepID=A0A5Q3Q7D1_9PSEU|nr:hypothetical protein [Allosaccharopolyspora coralli]QGK69740.1 hypothetical protein GIY23_09610 [Allosaccharopolyspora coralli]
MTTEIARLSQASLDPLHAMIYFAPESEEEFTALGLEKGLMAYCAGRAAAMGPVPGGVVAATFFNFNPAAVATVIPHAWTLSSPDDVIAARYRAVDRALRRLLGDEIADSTEVAESAAVAKEAAEACTPDGKPLYAGHADLEWPQAPHLRLWHGVTLLREFRGDAHVAALHTAGLSGLQALVLHVSTGKAFTESAAKATRAWSDEQWTATQHELREQGLLDEQGTITEEGTKLREDVETATDSQSMAPWMRIGAEKIERLTRHGAELSHQVLKNGGLPQKLFARKTSG